MVYCRTGIFRIDLLVCIQSIKAHKKEEFRLKKWKKTACLFLSLLTLLSFTGCQQQTSIRFGAAGLGGNYYAFATAFSELCAAQDEPYTIDVKSTAGSAANIRLLNGNYIELGIAQMDLVDEAYHGTGAYEKARYEVTLG